MKIELERQDFAPEQLETEGKNKGKPKKGEKGVKNKYSATWNNELFESSPLDWFAAIPEEEDERAARIIERGVRDELHKLLRNQLNQGATQEEIDAIMAGSPAVEAQPAIEADPSQGIEASPAVEAQEAVTPWEPGYQEIKTRGDSVQTLFKSLSSMSPQDIARFKELMAMEQNNVGAAK